jgi:hypothetical protein
VLRLALIATGLPHLGPIPAREVRRREEKRTKGKRRVLCQAVRQKVRLPVAHDDRQVTPQHLRHNDRWEADTQGCRQTSVKQGQASYGQTAVRQEITGSDSPWFAAIDQRRASTSATDDPLLGGHAGLKADDRQAREQIRRDRQGMGFSWAREPR